MNLIKFDLPPQLRTSTQIVGFHEYFLYIAPATENGIEVWCVHSMIPKSFTKMIKLEAREIVIREFALSPDGEFIYSLFIAILPGFEIPKVFVARIETQTNEYNIWELDFESADAFEQVYINNIGLICGETKLYMFDRTLVMGDIPFWEFSFNDEKATFVTTAKHIPTHDSSYDCVRFPVMHNPDNREVIKIDGSEMLLIFDDVTKEWTRFMPALDNQLSLATVTNRGIQETYGRRGHRVKAVQTKLTVFGRKDNCIFKMSERGIHTFYRFVLNREDKTYKLQKCKKIPYQTGEITYRLACTDKRVALVGRQSVVFVMIDPPSLKEACFWGAQTLFAEKMPTGSWKGGKTEEEIRDYFQIKSKQPLI